MSILNPFYEAIAWLVVHIHSGLAHVFSYNSGASWALSIVLLVMLMRLLLFPLFVKQIKNQRAMQLLQPKMKELQTKYKNDKEKLNQEMMALWREHGANPFSGCLPLILQIPVFLALFRVLNSIKPNKGLPAHVNCGLPVNYDRCFDAHYGISQTDVAHFALAKIFGVPISAAFTSSEKLLEHVNGNITSTRVLTVIMIVLMGASTFITQRQLMARNAATGAASMPANQKTLLYVLPLVFAVFGVNFPLGVLLYWLTTNLWSMGQQRIVIGRMDAAAAVKALPAPTAGPPPGAKPGRPSGPAGPAPTTAPATDGPKPGGTGTNPPRPGAASGQRRPANRNKRKRRR